MSKEVVPQDPITPQEAQIFIKAGADFSDLSAELVNDLQDGKLSTVEFLGLIDNVGPVIASVKDVAANRRKVRYLSSDQRAAIVAEMANHFNVSNDRAKQQFDAVLQAASAVDKMQAELRKQVKSLQIAFAKQA